MTSLIWPRTIITQFSGLVAELSRRCFQELALLQRSQPSVIGGSILAPVSNPKGGENLFSKPVHGTRLGHGA